jgi:PKD repeat protein
MGLMFKICLAIIVALALPASAAAAPGSVIAVDHEDFGQLFMDSSQADPRDNTVNILSGETVTFSYPAGTSAHNVDFTPLSLKPSTCVQTAGIMVPSLPIPPLPPFAQGPGWAGNCTFNTVGTYSFLCPVHPAMVGTVVVAPAQTNQPPTVSASRTPSGDVTVGTSVAFSAVGADPDGDTLTYVWDFGDGGTSTAQNPSHSYAAAGTFNAKVTVSDGKGATADTTLSVVVKAGNAAPTVTGSRTPSGTVSPGTPVAFTATGTDPDGDPLTYSWDFGDSGTSTSQNPTHTYAAAGSYTATVTVSDGRGGTGSATVSVSVGSASNQNPTVTAGRSPGGNTRVGVPLAFTATGTDADGDALTYAWDFGDGGTSSAQNPTHAYLTAATFTARVTVSDGRGGSATTTLEIVVQANRSPTISVATATPSDGIVPLTVQFEATGGDPDGHAINYEWDLDGNGTFETAQQHPKYTFTTAGGPNPVLRVTDNFGGSITRSVTINALPVTPDPAANFNALLFTKTAGFRHSNIDEGITAIKKLGAENHFSVDAIENASLFTDAFLSRYDVVIFLSTTGDVLDDTQQAAFERFIQSGKGYVGIHAAADSEYWWPWYGEMVGGYFRNHPPGTPTATVVREGSHYTTAHLPERWTRADEWYNYQGLIDPVLNGGGTDVSPRVSSPIHVLLTMDEATYVEQDGSDDVNDDHPIAWCKRYDGGRMFYTGLAHTEASFVEEAFLRHLQNGIEVSAGFTPDEACGVAATAPTHEAQVEVGADVPLVLGLSVSGAAQLGEIQPGVGKTYTASVAASVTSTAGQATLTVADPDTVNPGRLANGDYVLASPLRTRATNAANPSAAFAPLTNAPLPLLSYSAAISNDAVTLEFSQPVGANETLRAGSYGKTLRYTLSTTTP